ncbi:MAG: TIM barrel protein [Candidatus Lokiarchaeota archaeon]|nr:TIM barrel protein [Candidatus Lokiarchaeota archaeon]MBD3338956.1 TIM barrel protein [Candidatus Lokiarchaeota archaeon]
MRLAINHATLLTTKIDIFIPIVSNVGFSGVELRRDQIFDYIEHNSLKELETLLVENNIECISINAIELFSLCNEAELQRICQYSEELMKIGNQIGCDHLITVPSFLDDPYMDKATIKRKTIKRLKILLKLANRYNFRLSFEPLGFPNCSVRKLDFCLEILSDESLKNVGLVIDTFHFFIGENHLTSLEIIPIEKLWLVHINDAIEKPFQELKDSHRILPCQGFFNLEMFVKKLRKIGYDKWLSIELFNEEYWNEDPELIAQESIDALNLLLKNEN